MRNSLPRGFTLVEVVVMSTVALFAVAFFYRIQQRQVQVSVGDQQAARYYFDMTRFLEVVQNDAAMASKIERLVGGCRMEVRRQGGPETITYTRAGETVVREQAGKRRVFTFNPVKGKAPASFVFEIEEVSP